MQELPSPTVPPTGGAPLPTGPISFPFGLLGCEPVKRFELQLNAKDSPVARLRMLEGNQGFILVVPPGLFVKDYQPDISDDDAGFLGLKEPDDALVLNIVSRERTGTTLNLKAPIVINRHTLVGKQVIPRNSSNFDQRHPIDGVGQRDAQNGRPLAVNSKTISEANPRTNASSHDHLAVKRKWLEYALGALQEATVTDVACGSLEVTHALPLRRYLGMDWSGQALHLAARKRPDWFFVPLAGDEPAIAEADVVICLDIATRHKSRVALESLLRRLAQATRKRLILSGFNSPSSSLGETGCRQLVRGFLNRAGEFSEVAILGKSDDVSMIVADKRRPVAHPHDMQPAQFNEAAELAVRPDLFRCLVDLSRQSFHFYTTHFPRVIEYPWLAERLENLPAGGRLVEVGAGLSPLPLFLARKGASVDCIDSHPTKRTPPVQPDWTEWGFFDYSLLHPRLRSHHMSALDFTPEGPADVVYSVSVLEHMPRAVQKEVIACCRRWLKRGGRLLLTIDLIPGTNSIWNRSEGKEVEPVSVHGTIDDMLSDLRNHGFKPSKASTHRGVPHSFTDLLFIDCLAI